MSDADGADGATDDEEDDGGPAARLFEVASLVVDAVLDAL
jgi:hypothetical protein